MISITIMVIVVVAILTGIIFCLAWLGFSACLKAYKLELDAGKHDIDLCNEHYNNKNKQVIVKALSYAMTFVLLIALLGLFITGIVFTANNEVFSINDKTVFVIKSGSMSDFYSDKLKQQYEALGYNKDLQFSIGDICIFEKTDSLVLGEVYSYLYKDIIITHRLVDTYTSEAGITYYVFRGDNNPSKDQTLVSADKILYHYTGKKIPAIGSLILYAQSYIGIWALLSIMGIIVSSDIVLRKIQKLNEERLSKLGGTINE